MTAGRRHAVDVSVVIPMWNGAQIIGACLDALQSELRSSGLTHEIIVVDDGSRDESMHVVRGRYPSVDLLCNPINSGFAFTVNRGMRRARGNFILLLNTDAVVGPGSVRHVWEFMSADPRVGGAACKVLGYDGTLERSCREFPSLHGTFRTKVFRLLQPVFPRFAAKKSIECWPHDTVRSVDWIHMMFFMISRAAYDEVGGLDERFFMYGEDADYGWRIKYAGFSVMYTPDAAVSHGTSYSGNRRWGPMAVVKRQFALHELLRKWHSPVHVAAFRGASAILLVGQLGWSLIDRRFWERTSRDATATVALLRCTLGLMKPEELNGPRFDQHARDVAS